jgi:hypothetical protein
MMVGNGFIGQLLLANGNGILGAGRRAISAPAETCSIKTVRDGWACRARTGAIEGRSILGQPRRAARAFAAHSLDGRAGRQQLPLLQAPMHMIGEETSERLDVIPAQYRVLRLVDKRTRLQDPRTIALL